MPFDFRFGRHRRHRLGAASGALVLFMTPGLAFFYGGMVRAKNVLAMLMQNFFAMGIVSRDLGGGRLLPRLRRGQRLHRRPRLRRPAAHGRRDARLRGQLRAGHPAAGVRGLPADVRGHHAGADHRRDRRPRGSSARSCRSSRCGRSSSTARSRTGCSRPAAGCSSGARSTSPAAPWCTSTPVSPGLALALVLGRRRGWPSAADAAAQRAVHAARRRPPVVRLVRVQRRLGAGRQPAGRRRRSSTRNTAAAAAMLGWLVVEKLRDGKATTLGAASGAVAGLVAITPCAGFVSPLGSIAIGAHRRRRLRARGRA